MAKPLRIRALEVARTQLGVKEVPPNSNDGPEVRAYLKAAGIKTPAPWCAAFVTWCYERAGGRLTFPNRASVGFFEQWAAAKGYLVRRPFRGDLVCYRFDADDWPDHIGFVERVLALRWRSRVFAGLIQTIEGNTAVGNDANGGMVMRRYRWAQRCSFVRIGEP